MFVMMIMMAIDFRWFHMEIGTPLNVFLGK